MTASQDENSVYSKSPLAAFAPAQPVLFDIDGTLCDSDPLHYHAFREMLQKDSVSGIKAGVAAEMPVVGITTRNPVHVLMQAKLALIVKNYDDPKLWAALDELDRRGSTINKVWSIYRRDEMV